MTVDKSKCLEKKKAVIMTKALRKELNDQCNQSIKSESLEPPVLPSLSLSPISVKRESSPIMPASKDVQSASFGEIPFLQARCKIIEARNSICSFTAKLLFHESYCDAICATTKSDHSS